MSYIKVTKTGSVTITLNTIESAAFHEFMGDTNYHIRRRAVAETGLDTWNVEKDALLHGVWRKLSAVLPRRPKACT